MSSGEFPLRDLPGEMELSRLPLDASDEVLGDFASLVRIWRRKRRSRSLPPRSAFSPRDFLPRWIGWVVIDEGMPEPFDLYCRLFGSRVTELYGIDQSGKTLSVYCDHPTEGDVWRRYLDFMAGVVRDPAFVLMREEFSQSDRAVAADWLIMPLSNDGKTVTHFLSGVNSHIECDW